MNKREAYIRRMAEISGAKYEALCLWYKHDPIEDLSPETLKCAAEEYRKNREMYQGAM